MRSRGLGIEKLASEMLILIIDQGHTDGLILAVSPHLARSIWIGGFHQPSAMLWRGQGGGGPSSASLQLLLLPPLDLHPFPVSYTQAASEPTGKEQGLKGDSTPHCWGPKGRMLLPSRDFLGFLTFIQMCGGSWTTNRLPLF